jgi:hypothetical protein
LFPQFLRLLNYIFPAPQSGGAIKKLRQVENCRPLRFSAQTGKKQEDFRPYRGESLAVPPLFITFLLNAKLRFCLLLRILRKMFQQKTPGRTSPQTAEGFSSQEASFCAAGLRLLCPFIVLAY